MRLMRRLLLACSILFACLGAYAQGPSTPASSNLAGKVELVEGDVTVTDRARQPRRVAVGSTIFEGETIATGKDGELHVTMEDGGFIAVRPNTRMSIAAYRAEGDDKDKGIFSLLQGTFRSVTGWIGKYNPRSYQVRTPTATIGVRGTDHEPAHLVEGDPRGKPGSYDKVNAGLAVMQSAQGTVEIPANKAAFLSLDGLPPQLLEAIPEFFRPGAYEREFNARARQVERALDELRQGRIDELLRLKDGKLNLPKVPTRDDLRRGLGDFLRR